MPATYERDQKLFALLLSRDVEQIAWGAELACAIGERDLFDRMLRGVSWAPPTRDGGFGTLRVQGFCARSNARRRWDLVRAVALIAAAPPDCELAARVLSRATSLALDRALPPVAGDALDLAPLRAFRNLTRLSVRCAAEPLHLDALATHPSLEALTLDAPVRDLDALSGAATLRSLDLRACVNLGSLSFLRGMRALEHLSLALTRARASELAHLTSLDALRSLVLLGGDLTPAALTSLAALGALESIELVGVHDVRSLSSLRALPRLRRVVWREGDLEALDLEGAPALRELSINNTRRDVTRDLDALRGFDLRSLTLSCEVSREDLTPLGASAALERLSLRAPKLRSLDGLSSLASLTHLTLEDAASFASLSGLASAPRLEALTLRGCASLGALEGVEGGASLTWCELEGGAFEDVSALGALRSLAWVSLRGCAKVTDVRALEALPSLLGVILTGTGVSPESLSPKLRALAVFTEDSLAALASRVSAAVVATPPRLTPAARAAWPRVIALIRSDDDATIARGVALAKAIDDGSLYDGLLRGVRWMRPRLHGTDGRLDLRDAVLRVRGGDAHRRALLTLALLADAAESCRAAWRLRERVTSLLLSRPGSRPVDTDLAPLRTLTRARSLTLRDMKAVRNGQALDALTQLESLSLWGERVPVDFDPAKLASLRVIELLGVLGAEVPKLLRAPRLRVLRLRHPHVEYREGTLHIDGHSTLEALDLDAPYALSLVTIRACLALTDLTLRVSSGNTRIDVTGSASLRRLSISGYGSTTHGEVLGVDALRALTSLECGDTLLHTLATRAPEVAARIERLTLWRINARSCGAIAPFTGLRALAIRNAGEHLNVSDLAPLPHLRALDLAYCWRLKRIDGLRDLSLDALDLHGTHVDVADLPPSLRNVVRR
ncbi:MAG: hypothetical protein U0326_33785 [Polyangiales bacterium]